MPPGWAGGTSRSQRESEYGQNHQEHRISLPALAGAVLLGWGMIVTTSEPARTRAIIQGPSLAAAQAAVRAVGAEVTHELRIIRAVAVRLTPAERAELEAAGLRLYEDRAVRLANTTVTVRDEFETTSFANNDGIGLWAGDWIENDPQTGGAGPSEGVVQVEFHALRLNDYPDTGGEPAATRSVDLSLAVSATLSFDYVPSLTVDPEDAIAVEI